MEVECAGSVLFPSPSPTTGEHLMKQATPSKLTRKARRGQGMTEYIIIVALIAIAAIGVITLFGDNIRRLFGMSADALAGEDSVQQRAKTSNDTLEKKKMKNFGENNAY
jgi:pilus assembly protein Flp/PilA